MTWLIVKVHELSSENQQETIELKIYDERKWDFPALLWKYCFENRIDRRIYAVGKIVFLTCYLSPLDWLQLPFSAFAIAKQEPEIAERKNKFVIAWRIIQTGRRGGGSSVPINKRLIMKSRHDTSFKLWNIHPRHLAARGEFLACERAT